MVDGGDITALFFRSGRERQTEHDEKTVARHDHDHSAGERIPLLLHLAV